MVVLQRGTQRILQGGAANIDCEQPPRPKSFSFPTATESDLDMISIEFPISDSSPASLATPSIPTPTTTVQVSDRIRNCGSCTKFNDKGVMRICKPCYDLDSISANSAPRISFDAGEAAFVTPGVLAVVLVLLFLVAVALIDFGEWIWERLHHRPIALPANEKEPIPIEDYEEEDDFDEDEQLIP
ncbi:hypothetical protein PRK78_000167 [Emydomyces testavorans]|uniref:Uncharacterized protein n=1 Tax=Emydomyces testavorans TaxID=2070801 RepID=A0AAF0DC12_9EURO|nr:hypothetical protein PRK78_000167 [Emydomyces testavorans]